MKQVVFQERIPGLMAEQVIRDDNYSMDTRHMHSEYEIFYLLEGERYYFFERETFHIKPGTLLFIDREKIHKLGGVEGKPYFSRMLLEFNQEWIEDFFSRLRVIKIERFFETYRVVELDEEGQVLVKNTILAIAQEARDRKIGYEQMIRAKLMEMMLYVIRSRQIEMVTDADGNLLSEKFIKVNEVAEYIQENCHEEMSLQGLSDHFFVSKGYLSRIFKEVTSYTVNEYLTMQRIKKSRKLLEMTNYSITKVSELSGFESVTYFEKVFKKQMGQTPLRYRKLRLPTEN